MDIEGTYTLQALPGEVWRCLMDQQTIQYAIPGMERLTKIDGHNYTFVVQVRHAPLRGTYTGRASVLELCYPSSYCFTIEGGGQANQFHGQCEIQLQAHEQNTVVSYHGAIVLERASARIAAPLVKATIKVLLSQFFTTLAARLRADVEGSARLLVFDEVLGEPLLIEEADPRDSRNLRAERDIRLYRLVRLLGLGQKRPWQEEQWVRRLRRFGIIATLLFLVWVGTRLPRR